MDASKRFNVLGIETDVLVSSASTNDSFSMCLLSCRPGDGPPPHSHALGDEVFMAVSGDFQVFNGSAWQQLPSGYFIPALRGGVHTFVNSGSSEGRLLSVGISGRHDLFLQEIAQLTMPRDSAEFTAISERYGISYPYLRGSNSPYRSTQHSRQVLKPNKHLSVLGEDVEIVIPSSDTNDRLMILTQTSPPGGGVPVHTHLYEDEVFSVMEGEYEFFDGKAWLKRSQGDVWHAIRGRPHGFRNCGNTYGKIHAMAVPGHGLEGLLEGVSGLKAPEGLPQFLEICAGFGVTFE